MKDKKITYLLIVIVVIIWGIIIFKVVNVGGNVDENTTTDIKSSVKEPFNDYTLLKDTSHLLLNYPDPFRLTVKIDTAKLKVISHKEKLNVNIAPIIKWDFIKYLGYIRNPISKKLIAIVKINNKNLNMSEGEKIDKVTLVRNMRDSIKIFFNGKTKFITLNTGAL